jgi:integrase
MRRVRTTVPGLPEAFVFHDLRPCFASKSIRKGFDVERVRKLMRHAGAGTTLNAYVGMWPIDDDLVRSTLSELYLEGPEVDGVTELPRRVKPRACTG